jgi:hypothetical protein
MVRCEQNSVVFMVTYFDPPPSSIALDVAERTLEKDRDLSVRSIQGTLKSNEKISIQSSGTAWPGLACVFENDALRYTTRAYVVGTRVYTLQVASTIDHDHAADAGRFFESFKLAENPGK